MKREAVSVIALFMLAAPAFAGDGLKLNPKLDYTSDSQDGPLITGDNMDAGFAPGKPAYLIIYGEGGFNSKRQVRRTVGLDQMYKGRVQFAIIDIDDHLSREQQGPQEEIFPRLHSACRRARCFGIPALQPFWRGRRRSRRWSS